MQARTAHSPRITRRSTLHTIGLLGILGATWPREILTAQALPMATPDVVDDAVPEIGMPDWRFSLIELADPYGGDVIRPDNLRDGTRVIGCQVILVNYSEQPMEFTVRDIRLRDHEGIEYPAGDVFGAEPRVVSQNLPDGERTRGWVWFSIPEAHEPTSVVFVPPRPVLRIDL